MAKQVIDVNAALKSPITHVKMLLVGASMFNKLVDHLKRYIVGQDEYLTALALGLATGEHIALISPPGTGKTYIAKLLAKSIDGARFYAVQLNPYITFDELFGPLDPAALAQGKVERKWSKIVDADIVFLDEGFKANPMLLNSLLSFLQERIVYDTFTGTERKTPLKTAIIASNEVPEDESLRALYDRISIRVFSDYIDTSMIDKALAAYWRHGGSTQSIKPIISIKDVEGFTKLLEEAIRRPQVSLLVSRLFGLKDDFLNVYATKLVPLIVEVMKSSVNRRPSDRTLIMKLPKIILARALMLYQRLPPDARRDARAGRVVLLRAALDAVTFLADNRDEYEKIRDYIDSNYFSVYSAYEKLAQGMSLEDSDVAQVNSILA